MTRHRHDDPHTRCTHKRYRMTCAEYDALLVNQGGVCGVGLPRCKGPLNIDHDHALGLWAVRGLVCHQCNSGPLMMTDAGRWGEVDAVARYKANAWHLTYRQGWAEALATLSNVSSSA